jgi:hypothetical protein
VDVKRPATASVRDCNQNDLQALRLPSLARTITTNAQSALAFAGASKLYGETINNESPLVTTNFGVVSTPGASEGHQ